MVIKTSAFCAAYKVDANGRYAQYKQGKCEVCGKDTTQCDASMLWYGIPTYLCSDECHESYWKSISGLVNQTKED